MIYLIIVLLESYLNLLLSNKLLLIPDPWHLYYINLNITIFNDSKKNFSSTRSDKKAFGSNDVNQQLKRSRSGVNFYWLFFFFVKWYLQQLTGAVGNVVLPEGCCTGYPPARASSCSLPRHPLCCAAP